MRNRFNPNRLCSSENYAVSKRAHKAFISYSHIENKDILHDIEINAQVTIKRIAYIRVFGKLMSISEAEVQRLKDSVLIIYK